MIRWISLFLVFNFASEAKTYYYAEKNIPYELKILLVDINLSTDETFRSESESELQRLKKVLGKISHNKEFLFIKQHIHKAVVDFPIDDLGYSVVTEKEFKDFEKYIAIITNKLSLYSLWAINALMADYKRNIIKTDERSKIKTKHVAKWIGYLKNREPEQIQKTSENLALFTLRFLSSQLENYLSVLPKELKTENREVINAQEKEEDKKKELDYLDYNADEELEKAKKQDTWKPKTN